MDHDATYLNQIKPASSQVHDVRDAYAAITRDGLSAMAETVSNDRSYESNENGHFAWDISLLIRAACLNWRTTKDATHLSQASRWTQHLLERTDEALGKKDWLGKSRPIWSAGSRYTASTQTIATISGRSVRIQGTAKAIRITRPAADKAIVQAFLENGKTWTSPQASLLASASNYLPDILSTQSAMHSIMIRGLQEAVDLRGIAEGDYTLRSQIAPHFVHTGMIARALLDYAQTIKSSGHTKNIIGAEDALAAAEKALYSHDDEISVRQGQHWYITPHNFPGRRLGLDLPHNQIADAATSFLLIGAIRKDDTVRRFGRSLTHRFLREINLYCKGALSHPWHYYPVDSLAYTGTTRDRPIAERHIKAVPRAEDSSHATMRARALAEWRSIDKSTVSEVGS